MLNVFPHRCSVRGKLSAPGDRVREILGPAFRIDEGLVTTRSGPHLNGWRLHRVKYRGEERTLIPYGGLENFKVSRKDRDEHYGEGANIDDPNCRIAR